MPTIDPRSVAFNPIAAALCCVALASMAAALVPAPAPRAVPGLVSVAQGLGGETIETWQAGNHAAARERELRAALGRGVHRDTKVANAWAGTAAVVVLRYRGQAPAPSSPRAPSIARLIREEA